MDYVISNMILEEFAQASKKHRKKIAKFILKHGAAHLAAQTTESENERIRQAALALPYAHRIALARDLTNSLMPVIFGNRPEDNSGLPEGHPLTMRTRPGMRVESIDLLLLFKQKQAILRAIQNAEDGNDTGEVDLLNGVLNLMDHLHDKLDPPGDELHHGRHEDGIGMADEDGE